MFLKLYTLLFLNSLQSSLYTSKMYGHHSNIHHSLWQMCNWMKRKVQFYNFFFLRRFIYIKALVCSPTFPQYDDSVYWTSSCHCVVTVGVTDLWEETDPLGTKGGVELRGQAPLRPRASTLNGPPVQLKHWPQDGTLEKGHILTPGTGKDPSTAAVGLSFSRICE